MLRISWLLVSLLLMSGAAHSAHGVLVVRISGHESAAIMRAVEQSLIGRGWKIERQDERSIVGKMIRPPYRARIEIALVDGTMLAYEAIARRQPSTPSQVSIDRLDSPPPEWIDAIRQGILSSLGQDALSVP